MANVNRVLLIGNLTRDPELRYIPSGTAVASLRLAINSTYKDQAGQRKEEVCYVTVVVWAKQAELCNQYLKKGRSVCVEGRLIYRSWEAEGKTRSTLEVRADRVQFLGGPGGPGQGAARAEDEIEGHATPRVDDPDAGASMAEGPAEADVPF